MLRAVIVSPDAELTARLVEATAQSGRVGVAKTIDRYLGEHELERFLRANAPHVVFLDIGELGTAFEVIAEVEQVMPGVQIVAIDRSCEPQILLDLMHRGVREFLAYPFEERKIHAAADRLETQLEKQPAAFDATDLVFSFLPSKAGAGTSTIALNTAMSLSRINGNQTLLMDLDLNSGLIGFMLKLENAYTIYDAAENAGKLDEHLWPQLVASIGGLDVLPAGRLDPQIRVDPIQIRHLISFARRFYRSICIDLSGNMEKYSLEVMQESKKVFIVCTPEIPSLHLARQKLHVLNGLDLGDRVAILLNRSSKRPIISVQQIQHLLGVPVYMEFANDFRGVHNSVTSGQAMPPDSELGKQFAQLSYTLVDKTGPGRPAQKKKRFLEYFSVMPTPST